MTGSLACSYSMEQNFEPVKRTESMMSSLVYNYSMELKFEPVNKIIKSFSVKSEGLRRGQPISYTE